ncbi:MAG: hypothetical protein AAFY03_11635, partial [Pseudomonadota bacterium]
DMRGVSFGDALPLPEQSVSRGEVIPIPLSILSEKPGGGNGDLPWWAQDHAPRMFDALGEHEIATVEKPKRPGEHEYLFCPADDPENWLRYTPSMNVRLRSQIPKRGQADDTILFSLEEIAEETLFQTDIIFETGEAAEQFLEVFEPLVGGSQWLSLGRGGQPARIEAMEWLLPAEAHVAEDDWVLSLVSDLVIRGPTLGFREDLDLETLCELANVERKDDWTIRDAGFVATDTIHGFNAVSGIHRRQALAIRRGSAWVISGHGSHRLANALRDKQSLGEGAYEGLGRFVVGLQPLGSLSARRAPGGQVRQGHEERVLSRARALSQEFRNPGPSRSQLQWLSARASVARDTAELLEVLRGLESAPDERPRGGARWRGFPFAQMRAEIESLETLKEKQALVSHAVQWIELRSKQGDEKEGQ